MPVRNLRPVFYSVGDQPEVLSGWINLKTLDVFTTKADNFNDIELVLHAHPAFVTGERVVFPRAIDLYPAEGIWADERGSVVEWDTQTGAISIFLEGVHSGLEDNTLLIRPFYDDWIAQGLRRYMRPELVRQRMCACR